MTSMNEIINLVSLLNRSKASWRLLTLGWFKINVCVSINNLLCCLNIKVWQWFYSENVLQNCCFIRMISVLGSFVIGVWNYDYRGNNGNNINWKAMLVLQTVISVLWFRKWTGVVLGDIRWLKVSQYAVHMRTIITWHEVWALLQLRPKQKVVAVFLWIEGLIYIGRRFRSRT